jgi:hypothetical protein
VRPAIPRQPLRRIRLPPLLAIPARAASHALSYPERDPIAQTRSYVAGLRPCDTPSLRAFRAGSTMTSRVGCGSSFHRRRCRQFQCQKSYHRVRAAHGHRHHATSAMIGAHRLKQIALDLVVPMPLEHYADAFGRLNGFLHAEVLGRGGELESGANRRVPIAAL